MHGKRRGRKHLPVPGEPPQRNGNAWLPHTQSRQKPARLVEVRKPLFFHTKLRRVRLQAAARKFQRMLHMQHLVIEHVFHDVLWNCLPIQIAADDNLVQGRIETAQHAAPRARAPSQSRALQSAIEIPAVQIFEKWSEIVHLAARTLSDFSPSNAAQRQ
jgi:hypothetical protein